ncbi:MAG TPA: hypothetical protein VNO33_19790 [Kofleriaceae bacterium]|nr:hypothetical protein [Kofleriaceae bacterium]
MRLNPWIGLSLLVAVGAGLVIFFRGEMIDPAPAPVAGAEPAVVAAGQAPALPEPGADPNQAPVPAPESALQRELAGPERLEASAYPWDEFEAILGRPLTVQQKEAMRDLRKEHGLRLAETRAKMERGELARAEFDAWREGRAQEFRAQVEELLGCSQEEVVALLRVPMRTAGAPP